MKLRTDSSAGLLLGIPFQMIILRFQKRTSMRYYSDAYRMISGPRESIRQ